MDIIITPSQLKGEIKAINSKSQAHRLLIASALSDKKTIIKCETLSEDIIATANCLNNMGAKIEEKNGIFTVEPIKTVPKKAQIDCNESGSTLRFLLPVICALGIEATITMHGRLPQRPLSPLWEELMKNGCDLKKDNDKIYTKGILKATNYTLRSDVSSQFISGILFALPLVKGNCSLTLTGNTESASYIDLTVQVLEKFGIEVQKKEKTYTLKNSYTTKGEYEVEGDWSNGAFWICADYLSKNKVICNGLKENSLQGDKKIAKILKSIKEKDTIVDARDIPDLIPVISVCASLTPKRTTTIINAQRLKIKESDRLLQTKEMIANLGGDITVTDDGLIIKGKENLLGGEVHSANDHRIAMSTAVASVKCKNEVTLKNAQAVKKSYPDFWKDFENLGGKIREVK